MEKNHYLLRGVLSPVNMPVARGAKSAFLPVLLEKGEPGALVLGYNVSGGQGIDGSFTGNAGKVIEGHFPSAFELLEAAVKEIGLTGFFALDA